MLFRPPRKARPCLPILPENCRAIYARKKPKQHIRQQHPDGVLHALNASIALWVLGNVHLAKDAECNKVTQENKRIDVEKEPRLEQGQHEDERSDGAQGAAYHAPHPFAVDVNMRFARPVQVLGVETDDDDAEHELYQASEDADPGAEAVALPPGGGGFFAADAAAFEEVKGHDEELDHV
jgi:hypothetical protein